MMTADTLVIGRSDAINIRSNDISWDGFGFKNEKSRILGWIKLEQLNNLNFFVKFDTAIPYFVRYGLSN